MTRGFPLSNSPPQAGERAAQSKPELSSPWRVVAMPHPPTEACSMKRWRSNNPWSAVARDAARATANAQGVIALRLAMLARGGAAGRKEAHRMVAEKADALVQAQFAAAKSLASGKNPPAVMRETISIYGRRVRDNRRRLTGQWWRWWWS